MKRQTVSGGWHCDALPDGRFAILEPDRCVYTGIGSIAFPSPQQQPLFLRLKESPGLTFAGQAWKTGNDETLEYNGVWRVRARAVGVSPVIYNTLGNLIVNDGSAGSQGYRYNQPGNPNPITGDATYAPNAIMAPKLYEWTSLNRGDVLAVGQGEDGGVIVWDGEQHRLLASGRCRFIRAHRDGDLCSIAFYRELGGTATEAELVWATVEELRALPPVVWPEPEPPIGPIGPPLPDGTWVNLEPFFTFNAQYWPRGVQASGDKHGMNMRRIPELERNGDYCLWFQKFAEMGPQSAAHGELLSIDAAANGCIRLRADCSNRTPIDTWTDDRWLFKQMRIGRPYALITPDHELIKKDRDNGCVVTERRDFSKEMWPHAVYPRFYCGKDLGIHAVAIYVYNNTGLRAGQTTDNPDLNFEVYWNILDAGWGGWGSYRAVDVHRTGQFVLPSVIPPGQFFRKGGPDYAPDVPIACIPPATVELLVPETPLPPAVLTTIKRFALADPPPQGDAGDVQDNNCRAWMDRLCQTVKFFHGSAFGHKSTTEGALASKDVMAMREGAAIIHGYDVLKAAGSGQPVLNDPPSWINISDQWFIDVPAAARFPVAPPSGRPALTPAAACTSFDLSEALATGPDGEVWLKMLVAEKVTRPRILLARQPAHPTLAVALQRLPLLLARLKNYGMSAELTLLADTAKYGLSEAGALQWVRDCMALIVANPAGVGCIQGANEPFHETQQPFVSRASFMSQVAALVPNSFPYTPGASTNGGGQWGNVSYLTTHGDRSRTAYQNAAISKQLMLDTGLPVWEDEPIGVAEVAQPGRRTNDPQFGFELADAAAIAGLPGATYHFEAGLTCRVGLMGPIQLDGLRRYVARTGLTPIPPQPSHPVLDVDFRRYVNGVYVPDQLSDAGYILFVENKAAYRAEIVAWCVRATGIQPAESDIDQIYLRNLVEREPRFPTPRIAMTNKWPAGVPQP